MTGNDHFLTQLFMYLVSLTVWTDWVSFS